MTNPNPPGPDFILTLSREGMEDFDEKIIPDLANTWSSIRYSDSDLL